MKYKCGVCKRRFELKAKNRYSVVLKQSPASVLMGGENIKDAFDCPYCGCQNIVWYRLAKLENKEGEKDD